MTRSYCIKQGCTLTIILHLTLSVLCHSQFSILFPAPAGFHTGHLRKIITLLAHFWGYFFFLHFEALNEPRQETKIVKYRGVKEQ